MKHKSVCDIRIGDRVLFFNTQLENPFSTLDKWKVLVAIVTNVYVRRRKGGWDSEYQLYFGDICTGWYQSGYLFNLDVDFDPLAIPLESLLDCS